MRRLYKIILTLSAIWIFGKFVGCALMLQGPWGPEVKGTIPQGGVVVFQSRPVGRETDDRLSWITSAGERKDFWVNQTHAGPSHVTIRMSENGKGIWVEFDGSVGASLDIETGEFRDELDLQLPWAKFGRGTIIAQGRTWSLLHVLGPW
jgi:hypothetical protein